MINIAVLGYGTVGSGVVEVINTNHESINKRAGDEINIKYVLDLRDFPGDPVEKVLVHDYEVIVNDPEVDIVVEVMGRYAGFIGIASAIAGGCDAALIPEIPYDINKVADAIKANRARGKNFALVVVAEGAKPLNGEVKVAKVVADSPDPIRLGGIGEIVSEQLERLTGLESRATILGHVQRGGSPTANDRILSTRYGTYAVELLMQGKFGNMVVLNGSELSYNSLENVIGKNKAVEENSYWIQTARGINMCLGD